MDLLASVDENSYLKMNLGYHVQANVPKKKK
jgi:hypothetical protein